MKTISREEFEKRNVFGTGAENTGFAQYVIGNSYLNRKYVIIRICQQLYFSDTLFS